MSIPVSDNAEGVNYLLGVSAFLGDENRISFTTGVMYGPVRELKDGIVIGGTTTATDDTDITRKVYGLGYFIGVSFSLFDVKN